VSRRRITGVVARAALATIASGCVALAVHGPAQSPEARLELASGTLSLSNSLAGAAILSARNLQPGETASGTVTIANSGTASGAFTLSSVGVTDVPGPRGGLLSRVLSLSVADVTNPAAPVTSYAGPLGSMTPRSLGVLPPGLARTYRFTVALPATGAGLDAVQGAEVTVGYRWDANGSDDATPPPTGTLTQPPTTTATTPPPDGAAPPPVDLVPYSLKLAGRSKWSARSRSGPAITARCTRVCSMRVAVRVRGIKKRLRLKVRSKPMASAAGGAMRFEIVLVRSVRATVRRALRAHKRITLAVTVDASDLHYRITATARKRIQVTP